MSSSNVQYNTPETKTCLPLLHRSKPLAVSTIKTQDIYTQAMKAGYGVNLPLVSIVSNTWVSKPSNKHVILPETTLLEVK